MRLSRFYAPTLKETPADAEVVSHQLMLRAGMIRFVHRGCYDFLPLGLRVIKKIEQIVREEMDRAGANEVLLPIVQPKELWQETGRWDRYIADDQLGHFFDSNKRELCLAPTAEEVMTDLVRKDVQSYKQLPLNLYQIHWKFRDEIRPRFGLMRGREFLMKDAYSFDKDQKSAYVAYDKMYGAYKKIFTRCGLEFRPVEAATGAIGGNKSHEFQVLADTGEDAIATCEKCDYAANVELAEIAKDRKVAIEPSSLFELDRVATPGKKAIADVAAFLEVLEAECVKGLLYETDTQYVLALLRGDTALSEEKLKKVVGAQWIRFATQDQVYSVTGADIGFVGPVLPLNPPAKVLIGRVGEERLVKDFSEKFRQDILKETLGLAPTPEKWDHALVAELHKALQAAEPETVRSELRKRAQKVLIVADHAVANMSNYVTGGIEGESHFVNVNHDPLDGLGSRDYTVDKWADLRTVQAGDRCPRCAYDDKETGEKAKHGTFAIRRGVEVGHVFYLGTKYSSAMKAVFKEESGKEKPFEMGCYGIGITRVAAAAIEQNHDKAGIVWPAAIAPFQVLVLSLNADKPAVVKAADEIYEELRAKGVDVVIDDRAGSAGFKFNDADLIGIPYRIVVGDRGLAEGKVETKVRKTRETKSVPPADAIAWAIESVKRDLST